jgi:hypothetical protein
MDKKSPGPCRSTAASADVSPDPRHRDHVFPGRPHRDKNDQGEHERRKYRQYRQHRQCCPQSWVSSRSSHPGWGQRINLDRADDADGADANPALCFGEPRLWRARIESLPSERGLSAAARARQHRARITRMVTGHSADLRFSGTGEDARSPKLARRTVSADSTVCHDVSVRCERTTWVRAHNTRRIGRVFAARQATPPLGTSPNHSLRSMMVAGATCDFGIASRAGFE